MCSLAGFGIVDLPTIRKLLRINGFCALTLFHLQQMFSSASFSDVFIGFAAIAVFCCGERSADLSERSVIGSTRQLNTARREPRTFHGVLYVRSPQKRPD
jgi:hypothetical protein